MTASRLSPTETDILVKDSIPKKTSFGEIAPPDTLRRTTRQYPNLEEPIARLIQEVTIRPDQVTGQLPLVLGFEEIFVRPAVPPESDITFPAEDLSKLAEKYWGRAQ